MSIPMEYSSIYRDSQTMDDLEKQLICPICLEMFTKPVVILPCQHNLCRKCANDIFQSRGTALGSGGRFRCPSCRQEVVLDRHGVYGLQRNLLVENIIDIYKQESSRPNAKAEQPVCEEHDEERINIYCVSCEVPTCSLCKVFGAHKDCEVAPLITVYKQQKSELSDEVGALVAANAKLQGCINQLEETTRNVEYNCRSQKQMLCEKFNSLYTILETRKQEMLQRITGEQDEKISYCKSLMGTYGEHVHATSKLVETALQSMEEPQMAVFLQNAKPMTAKVSEATRASEIEELEPDYETMEHYNVDFEKEEKILQETDFIKVEEETEEGFEEDEECTAEEREDCAVESECSPNSTTGLINNEPIECVNGASGMEESCAEFPGPTIAVEEFSAELPEASVQFSEEITPVDESNVECSGEQPIAEESRAELSGDSPAEESSAELLGEIVAVKESSVERSGEMPVVFEPNSQFSADFLAMDESKRDLSGIAEGGSAPNQINTANSGAVDGASATEEAGDPSPGAGDPQEGSSDAADGKSSDPFPAALIAGTPIRIESCVTSPGSAEQIPATDNSVSEPPQAANGVPPREEPSPVPPGALEDSIATGEASTEELSKGILATSGAVDTVSTAKESNPESLESKEPGVLSVATEAGDAAAQEAEAKVEERIEQDGVPVSGEHKANDLEKQQLLAEEETKLYPSWYKSGCWTLVNAPLFATSTKEAATSQDTTTENTSQPEAILAPVDAETSKAMITSDQDAEIPSPVAQMECSSSTATTSGQQTASHEPTTPDPARHLFSFSWLNALTK